ncbi:hypothetical protein PENSPDRAFT_604419, partial [Peniophora sp. CONT]
MLFTRAVHVKRLHCTLLHNGGVLRSLALSLTTAPPSTTPTRMAALPCMMPLVLGTSKSFTNLTRPLCDVASTTDTGGPRFTVPRCMDTLRLLVSYSTTVPSSTTPTKTVIPPCTMPHTADIWTSSVSFWITPQQTSLTRPLCDVAFTADTGGPRFTMLRCMDTLRLLVSY